MNNDSNNIAKLEAIVPQLVSLINNRRGGWVDYKVPEGLCRATNLLNIPAIAVKRVSKIKGTKLEEHSHSDSKEWLIVFKGGIRITISGTTQDVGSGEHICVDTGVPHSVIALEDTELIGITIPKDEGYPDD